MKPARQKRCHCGRKFYPFSTLQKACSVGCALEIAPRFGARAYRASRKVKRERLMTRSDWLKRAQKAFNAFIRARDASRPCISCGTTSAKWDAGHYRSVGACPELRFSEFNTHRQCMRCNSHLSGNAIDYRIGLVKRIGAAKVRWIEGHHAPKKYTVEQIQAIEVHYKQLAKQLTQRKAA